MRISDWSSDVCSSDLLRRRWRLTSTPHAGFSPSSACSTSKVRNRSLAVLSDKWIRAQALDSGVIEPFVDLQTDRNRLLSATSVSVSVDHGGPRSIRQITDPSAPSNYHTHT